MQRKFPLSALVVLTLCLPSVWGQQPQRDPLAALTQKLSVEHITIHFAPSSSDDAQKVARYLPTLLKQLREHFRPAGLDPYVAGFRCDLYLHPQPNESASESSAYCRSGTTDGTNATYFAEIHLLSPSAHRTAARTHIGELKDDVYFERLLVHEYAAPVLDRITRSKPRGWRFFDAPRWFIEGYEEYLALTCSNDHSRSVTLKKYKQIGAADKRRVRNDFGLSVRDNYLDGALIVAFMHDRFGKEKVQAALTADADSFGEALSKSLGVNLDSFFAAWTEWLAAAPGP